ncbi:hypothetical protein Vretimale_12911 [Volvox reticuliferus]|uniref:Uncharacterized protein n=1 Tax=Volvox reticuliferus TaxID=1737510 RepID=A0A8J4FLJ0_9CHLO|nr:hypothetical protein Vretifemale_9275 [Volvox reticuliferus]GIM09010.1 hypothetical protein Vretimale_12911 [Volvox reticuliferus]
MAANSASVLTNFLINLYIFLGCFGAFSILRVRPWARRFFAARRYAKDIDLKPKRLDVGLLSWIWPVITYPEGDIIDEAGLDCAMYLRILRFGVYLFFPLTIFCIIVVLPPNMTSNGIQAVLAEQAEKNAREGKDSSKSDLVFSNFDHYSLSNVESGSRKMWTHLVATYCVVSYTLWLLWRFNRESVILRLLFLGNAQRGGPSHTVLVTDIPGVKEAVAKSLQNEKSKRKLLKKADLEKSTSQKSVDVQTDDSVYLELPGTPHAPDSASAKLTASGRKAKSVSICEPPVQQQPSTSRFGTETSAEKGKGSSPAAGSKRANSTVSSATAASSVKGSGSDSDEYESVGKPDTEKVPPAAAASAKGSGFGSRFNLRSFLGGSSIDLQYRLVDETVDPKYAATGGKLELARVGKTNEEILAELLVLEKDGIVKGLPENLAVDTRPLPRDRRNSKHYQYPNTSLLRFWQKKGEEVELKGAAEMDPVAKALATLRKGVTPQQMVAREFAMMYGPNIVAAVNMIQDTTTLEPLVEEYDKICQELDDYLEMAKLRLKLRKSLPQKQLTIIVFRYKEMDCVKKLNKKWLAKVDAVEFWLERLRFLRDRIKVEQSKCMRKIACSAFVTFNTRTAQAVAANTLHSHDENAWRVQGAPAPFELVWKNLSFTMPIKNGRLYILWAGFWAMTIFFMVPVAAIQAMIEVPKLAKVPVLGKIVTTPPIKQLMQAVIPGLVLKIFLAIVPTILRIMAILSGSTSISEIDFGVVKRFFLFQVVVVFFGTIIAGSFFNQLQQWVKNPTGIVTTLGKSIPMTSTFFITYLLINGLGVKSMAFIRLPNFVIFWVLSKFAGSPRARQRMWMYQYTSNGTTVVDHTIALLLGLTFSCINPIVCPAALAYFLVNFVGETYNNVYVYRRQYESAGMLWKTVYNQVMVGLYIMQLTMLGLLSIKKFKYSFFMFPLIIFSITSHISTLQLYSRPWSVTALHDAAYMDMLEADQRRMELLQAARDERKKKRDKIKRAYDEAVRKAENNDDPPPPYDTRLDEIPPPGGPGASKSELLLLETIEGDGFALNSVEKREVEEMYMNPVFKVNLGEVERLSDLATEVQSRLPRLNEWVAEYKKYRRETKKRKLLGETEILPPPKMPEDLTIYDADPNLQDSDDDDDRKVKTELNPVGSVQDPPANAPKGPANV